MFYYYYYYSSLQLQDIAMYSEEDKSLYVYNVNGKLLCTTKTNDSIVGIYITADGRYVQKRKGEEETNASRGLTLFAGN